MNLLQLRTKFREISGRFDLVNEDFSDNGADFYINEGRKFLDRLDETSKSWASCFRFVEIDHYAVSIPQCRAIKEVWAATTSARWQLKKKTLQDLTAEYLTTLPSGRTSGSPAYYSPQITRYIPDEVQNQSFEGFLGYIDIPSGDVSEYNTILLNVPVSERTLIEVRGLFYSAELSADTDTNSWSVNHPLLLISAAMRYVEVVNRNTQGVNDWTNAILVDMKQIGMDLVEELIAEVTQIED